MCDVINLAAFKDNRRAEAERRAREAAAAERREKERQELADALGGTAGAHIVASVVSDLREAEKAARAPQFVPAYCDPANETRGSKYEATRDLSLKEIAARIRADIKAAIASGALPKGLKTRCYMPHYGSIEVRVVDLPEGFKVMSEAGASWSKQFPEASKWSDMPGGWKATRSDELNDLLDKLDAIHGAYNRDNSDSMTDYFDTRYYGRAEIDSELRRTREAAEIAASPGTYWEPDACRR